MFISEVLAKKLCFEDWTIDIDVASGAVTIDCDGKLLLNENIAAWGVNDNRKSMADCENIKVKFRDNADIYGKGKAVIIAGRVGDVTAELSYYLYSGENWLLTELAISSNDGVEANFMAPISSSASYELFKRAGNYSLFIPFDNDAWVRYKTFAFGSEPTESYGVTAFFNADTREGFVVGAVEHDNWKTGIRAITSGTATVDSLQVYGGASSVMTRDVIPHGTVVGQRVKSPRMIVGLFDDWRAGMETFADLCATFAPKIESRGSRPFGWNSWGKLQTKITYDKAIEVSDFIHDYLQGNSFNNEGTVYVDLDAFWDFGFKKEQHRLFVEHCHKNGQKPGIYWCPFTDWGKNPDAVVAEMPEYKWKDIYLYGNGKPIEFDGAYAIDPTHPATKKRIEVAMKQFIEWGYEYVKIDFMAHGAYESDYHYDKTVTTGVQAYNQGMKYINEMADGKLWINLSIAPLFPANYAHSRRIGCDAWADINNTEYSLNSLTYGWWLDRVYHYNDADHIVFEGVTDGENRARITSSAITGVYFLGDDMSLGGNEATKKRVIRNATNADINEMARQCKSFRPVEHGYGDKGADMFYYETDDAVYVAVFNFTGNSVTRNLPLHRLGLSNSYEYDAKELWSCDKIKFRDRMIVEIPAKDVKVFKISLK